MFKRFVTLFLISTSAQGYGQKALQLTVSNNGDARKSSIISFPYKQSAGKAQLQLVDRVSKAIYPVQVLPGGEAVSIIDIDAGEKKVLSLAKAKKAQATITAIKSQTDYSVMLAGKQVLGFQTGQAPLPDGVAPVYRRGGYVHPVLSPGGLQITDDYPSDHKHHHGVWAAWTKTSFRGNKPDFWNVDDNTGAVLFEGIDHIQSGPVLALLSAKNSYIDKTSIPHTKVLDEDFTVRVFNLTGSDKPYYLFDVELRQECATSDPLKLLHHIYGGIAFRGNGEWNGTGNANFLTSVGKDRETGNATAADWIRVSGNVAGQETGITILSHPENFRAPQPLRIHPKEPYISFAPSQAGEFVIEPGKPYIARYRFIVYDGDADIRFIDRMWRDYSKPLEVKTTMGEDQD
ncbi:PmoA family protein [Arcticibacter sp.]|uniref:DUF6807 domain-containing protein n=1 Tax=Arcticibacter sp. TaxID=1872630 RepID=UPI00388EC478